MRIAAPAIVLGAAIVFIHCGDDDAATTTPPGENDAGGGDTRAPDANDTACTNRGARDPTWPVPFNWYGTPLTVPHDGSVFVLWDYETEFGAPCERRWRLARLGLPLAGSQPNLATMCLGDSAAGIVAYDPASRVVVMVDRFGTFSHQVNIFSVSADDPAWATGDDATTQMTILYPPSGDGGVEDAGSAFAISEVFAAQYVDSELVVAGSHGNEGRGLFIEGSVRAGSFVATPVVEPRMARFVSIAPRPGGGAWLVGIDRDARPAALAVGRGGIPDTAVGDAGFVAAEGPVSLVSGAVDATGRLLIGAWPYDNTKGGADQGSPRITRFTAKGALDTTYGEGGTFSATRLLSTWTGNIAVERNGGAFIGGVIAAPDDYPPFHSAFVRATADGRLDSAFGEGGIVVAPERPQVDRLGRSGPGVAFVQDPARAECDETLMAVFGPIPNEVEPEAVGHVYR